MKVKLKDIQPNPFRDMSRYTPNPDKVSRLKKSIEDTDFWDNIVARKEKSVVEIAYGHHRLIALRELYSPEHEVSLITKKLDDTAMLKIMANENMEEWDTSSAVERETVRATVQAYADGRIVLPSPDKKTSRNQLRCAPNFESGCAGGQIAHPYTGETIATFLSWSINKIKRILQALELIEAGHVKEKQMAKMTAYEAQIFITEVSKSVKLAGRALKQAEDDAALEPKPAVRQTIIKQGKENAKQIVKRTSHAASTATGSGEQIVKKKARAARTGIDDKQAKIIDINDAAITLANQIQNFLTSDAESSVPVRLTGILKFKQHINTVNQQSLLGALNVLIDEATKYRNQLK